MCTESMIGVNRLNTDEYASLMIFSEIMTYNFLHPLIREKGGAYGSGCSINESGTLTFYSYRDPKVDQTYENFEKSL